MGNLCSKSANSSDNFSQPGRRLGGDAATPPNKTSAQVPSSVIASSPGRTLGGTSSQGNSAANDAKSAAARAAEERAARANKPGGKLASDLSKQRAKTQNQTLSEASQRELGARTADELAQTRAYN